MGAIPEDSGLFDKLDGGNPHLLLPRFSVDKAPELRSTFPRFAASLFDFLGKS